MVLQVSRTRVGNHHTTTVILLQGKIIMESQATDIILSYLLSQLPHAVKPYSDFYILCLYPQVVKALVE